MKQIYNVFLESVGVGIYTALIYAFIKWIFGFMNFQLLLFVVGVCKHFFGFALGLQTMYCKMYKKNSEKAISKYLVVDCIAEGIGFIMLGNLLKLFVWNFYALFFSIGVTFHILAEYTRIHKLFLAKRCS